MNNTPPQGILLINKPAGRTSFSLIPPLRKRLGVSTIGHAGTLDPFATGLMVILVGRDYTRLSDRFLNHDKEYQGRLHLGVTTDTYDNEGKVISSSEIIPTLEEIQAALTCFQGVVDQIPPMFSAKKIDGKKLCDLARKGKEVERAPVKVEMHIELINYSYPYLDLYIACSKGTYIRSLAYDLGVKLGCGAHLCQLERTRSGPFKLEDAVDWSLLNDPEFDVVACLSKSLFSN
jgi:tRNA pseudouridine55 synthase